MPNHPIESRSTRTVAAVRTVLRDLDRAISAQELYRLLHHHGVAPGLASVYRALDHLVTVGEAERLRRGTEDAYVLCPQTHHHHAICRDCGRVDVLKDCRLQAEQPARSEQGFVIDAHQTVYYGRCPQCCPVESSGTETL